MCMAFFVGHGYSDAFSSHMAALLEALSPESPIRLTVNTDAVCGPCPNNREGVCDKPDLVAGYDQAVLALCGLQEGCLLSFGAFTRLIQKNILSPGLRPAICGSCQWNRICSTQPSRWEDDPSCQVN